MSRIISAVASEDYTVTIDFDHGNRIVYNMQDQVKALPFLRLKDLESFKAVRFDDKSIYWNEFGNKGMIPLRLSLDQILFSLRD